VDNVYDLRWSEDRTYGQVRLAEEQQFSRYSFELADPARTRSLFETTEAEALALLATYKPEAEVERRGFPVLAVYDLCLRCSHLFNLLDARGVIAVTERAALIGRIRRIASRVAAIYVEQSVGPSAPAVTT
jgi:glycyl-tRNA synthetase alpha chain